MKRHTEDKDTHICMELRMPLNRFPAKKLGEGPLALEIVLSHLQLAI